MFICKSSVVPIPAVVLSSLMFVSSFFPCVLFFSAMHQCQAQLLHPHDMATGNWKLSIRRRDSSLFESMIFPKKQLDTTLITEGEKSNVLDGNIEPKEEGDTSSVLLSNHDDSCATATATATSTTAPTVSSSDRKLGRCMECDLFLDDDGTFTLRPPIVVHSKVQSPNEQLLARRQSLKGYWHLRPNPYCVTDRQYDELILESIPKVRVFENGISSDANKGMGAGADEGHAVDKITIEMRCNVWGRFGSNSIRRLMRKPTGKSAGRLTHGKLSIIKVTSDVNNGDSSIGKIRRVLCATFRAKHE